MIRLGIILLVASTAYSAVIQTTTFQSGSNRNTDQKCLTGSECSNQNSYSLINNQLFCCPNGYGISSMSSWSNGQSYIDCTCSSGGVPANFDWNAWNTGWNNFNNGMSNMDRQLGNMSRRLSNMFSGGFPFNNRQWW